LRVGPEDGGDSTTIVKIRKKSKNHRPIPFAKVRPDQGGRRILGKKKRVVEEPSRAKQKNERRTVDEDG